MRRGSNRVGILYGVIIVAALATFIWTYLQKNRVPSAEERTSRRAEIVGRRLIEDKFEQKVFLPATTPERGLASEADGSVATRRSLTGEVGRDAWGQPFYFQVKGDGIKDSILYIWSYGANGNADFKDVNDLMARGPVGDDVLVTIPF